MQLSALGRVGEYTEQFHLAETLLSVRLHAKLRVAHVSALQVRL